LEVKFEDNCASLVSSIFDDYLYLHSRAFNPKENIDVKFQVTLKRNILYIFNVCGGAKGENNMVLKLFDNNDKLIASSVDKKGKTNSRVLVFKPEKAGKYYISAFFKENEATCWLVLFGMIKNNINEYYNVPPNRDQHLDKK